MANSRGYYLRFPCPDCGATQKVLPAQVGTEIRCTECPAVITVPSLERLAAANEAINRKAKVKKAGKRTAVAAGDKPPPPPLELNIIRGHVVSFACPSCHTMMRASEEELGHVIMCPTCYSPVTVGGEKYKKTLPPPEPPSLVLEDTGEDEPTVPEEAAAARGEDAEVRPSEDAALPASRNGDQESSDDYQLSAPAARPFRPSVPPWIDEEMGEEEDWTADRNDAADSAPRRASPAAATRDPSLEGLDESWAIEERRDRPTLEERLAASVKTDFGEGSTPDHPFLSGVFGFLLYPGSWRRWVGLAVGTAIVYYFAANAVRAGMAGGSELFFSLIFATMAAASAFLLVMFASVAALAIVQDTAAGSEEVETWPDFNFIDWAGQAFYVLNAVAFSALPGFLLASTFEEWGPWRWAAPAASGALLLPVVLLSQLAGDSPFSIVTPGVLKSLYKAPLAWLAFYCVSLPMLAAAVGAGAVVLLLGAKVSLFAPHGWLTSVILAAIATAALMLESRLIGRLAWFCEEEPLPKPPAEAEGESAEMLD